MFSGGEVSWTTFEERGGVRKESNIAFLSSCFLLLLLPGGNSEVSSMHQKTTAGTALVSQGARTSLILERTRAMPAGKTVTWKILAERGG